MVHILIEDYCEECSEFEPEVTKAYADNYGVFTTIRCEHAERCSRIYTTIKNSMERIKNDTDNE